MNPASPSGEARAPLVGLRGVTHRYEGGPSVLEGLELVVREGEFVCLLGASGCGKSTVLRILAGLVEPSAGTVGWEREAQRGERRMGCVFQEPTLMPWARAAENVYLPLRLAGVSRAEAAPAVAEALRRVGLEGAERAFPHALSGGMRMRVSLARALVTRPRLLLLDEPFAALDEITRLRLDDDLLALRRTQGFAVLFVTHSVFESVALADRVLVMSGRPGRVVADIAIDAPADRGEAFRSTASYAAQCGAVSQALRAAADPPRADAFAPAATVLHAPR